MKTKLTLFLFCITIISYSQNYDLYDINFDDPSGLFRIKIDSISNPNNIWQIGQPQKTILTNAFSAPNVIITDRSNSYPVNDTSMFLIYHIAGWGFVEPYWATMNGYYFVNSDTITDFGTIEFSPDNGNTWINLLTDTIYNDYIIWDQGGPVLSGNSCGWKYFNVHLSLLGPVFNLQMNDTIIYKYSFVTDSLQTYKDGLMFDNLHFEDWTSGIEEIGYEEINSQVFPNPANSILTIKFENSELLPFQFSIHDIRGEQIISIKQLKSSKINIDVNEYVSGQHYYKLINAKERISSIGKFMVVKD